MTAPPAKSSPPGSRGRERGHGLVRNDGRPRSAPLSPKPKG